MRPFYGLKTALLFGFIVVAVLVMVQGFSFGTIAFKIKKGFYGWPITRNSFNRIPWKKSKDNLPFVHPVHILTKRDVSAMGKT